jgi:hypothetical protein
VHRFLLCRKVRNQWRMCYLSQWKVFKQRRYRVSKLPKVGTLQLCTRFAHTQSATSSQREGGFNFQPLVRRSAEANACSRTRLHSSPHISQSTSGAGAASCTCNAGFIQMPGGWCQACDEGKYTPGDSRATCEECPVGKTSGQGAPVCNDCDAGTYADSTGSPKCKSCPQHSTTLSPGADQCTCNTGTLKLRMYSATHSVQSLCKVCARHTSTHLHTDPLCPLHAKRSI